MNHKDSSLSRPITLGGVGHYDRQLHDHTKPMPPLDIRSQNKQHTEEVACKIERLPAPQSPTQPQPYS